MASRVNPIPDSTAGTPPRPRRWIPISLESGVAVLLLLTLASIAWALRAQFIRSRKASESRLSPAIYTFQVTTMDGRPVAGATVTPQGFQASGPNCQFQLNGKRFPQDVWLFPPATTNAQGRATIALPDDAALAKAAYPPAIESRLRETLRQPDLTIDLRIDHPDHPRWRERFATRFSGPIVLPDSATLVIRAQRSDDKTPARNLYPVLSQSWEGTDFSEKEGLLTVRRIDLTSNQASQWLRIVHVVDEGPAWFSELIDLKQQTGLKISLDVVLKPGVRFEGRLPENVSRPIKNGRVAAMIHAGNKFPDAWLWEAAADIDPDGTFVVESLPENENVQLVAFCDGWVSRSPSADEVKAYAAQHSFSAPEYEQRLQAKVYRAFPQLFRLNGPVTQGVVPMGRTASAEVWVEDENGKPIENAWIAFSPNVLWFSGGAALLRAGDDQLAMIRAELASGQRPPKEAAWMSAGNRYSARTNAQGVATVSELPVGSTVKLGEPCEFTFNVVHEDYMRTGPPVSKRPADRDTSTIDLVPGQIGKVTVRMKRK